MTLDAPSTPVYFEPEKGPSDRTKARSNLILTQNKQAPPPRTYLLLEEGFSAPPLKLGAGP